MKTTPWNPPLEGRIKNTPSKRGEKPESTHDFSLTIFGALRAYGEVCPKHRKIRHESLRVRPGTGGNGFVLSGMRCPACGVETAPNHPTGTFAQPVFF